MTRTQFTIVAIIAGVTALPSTALADHVVLTNGDTLTGTIVSRTGATLVLDTELAGRVTIKTADVTSVTPPPPDQAVTEEASWHGSINAGLDVSRGNSVTETVSTSGAATRVGRRDRLGVFGTFLFSSSGDGDSAVTTARATRGGTRYDRDLGRALFGFGFGDVENDPLQLLDLRTVVGGGAGVHVWKRGATQFNVFGGVSYARDAYADQTSTTAATTTVVTPGQGGTPPGKGGTPPGLSRSGTPPSIVRTSLTRAVGEIVVGQDLTQQLSDSISLSEGFRIFPAIDDFSDYRVSFDLSLSAQLNGWLQWNLNVADRYLHIPPAGGAVQNDTFVSTGLGIMFGKGGGSYGGSDGRRSAPPRR